MKGFNILLYIWQLPQNLLGMLLLLYFKGVKHSYNGITYYHSNNLFGGISIGEYIIVNNHYQSTIKHEYGHVIQSRYLGFLYLLVIGLPSLIHAGFCKCKNHNYYDFYTEKWADALVGIRRK